MQKSNAPTKLTVAFASGTGAGPVNNVPLTPGATPGTASYQTGFTAVNMEPIASGGVPPFGADFNGVFQAATTAQIWQQSGYMWPFDSTFAGNANIGGYPSGSVLMMGNGKGLWINQTDNNTHSPDATGSTGWLGIPAAGVYTIATTGGTTTPDASVLGITTLLVTGTLASNATIVLPLSAGSRWIIANNTTGSFTLTVQGATGAGVAITQGSALTVFTDGTAYFAASANLSGAYLPIDGTAVAATKLATARAFSITGLATASGVNFDGTGAVTLNVTALNVPSALGYTPANDASVVHIAGTETVTGVKTFSNPINASGGNFTGQVNFTYGGATSPATLVSWGTSDPNKRINLKIDNSGAFIFQGYWYGSESMAWQMGSTPTTVMALSNAGLLSTTGGISTTTGTFNGALTYATSNATASDRRLKRNIRKFDPRPLHRSVRFVSYTLKSNGWYGLGAVAQEMQACAPEHVTTFQQDGKDYLGLDYTRAAYEQATWAGHEIDRLAAKIAKLERKLARASIHPRQRGFLRLLLEAIW